MDAVFGNEAVKAPVEGATDVKKEKIKQMKSMLKETINSDPEYIQKLHTLSDSLEVVNTLGYGTNGNIVVDKAASKNGERTLKSTSAICGYIVKNIGSEPITYTTELYKKDETGKYVGEVVSATAAPGETFQLARLYMTMLCSKPEISFALSNGKIVASSKKKCNSVKEELASYYFTFNKGEDGTGVQVNDDEVKISIDKDGVIKAEYEATFGFLANPKESRAAKVKGQKLTTQDAAANYINKMLASNGMI